MTTQELSASLREGMNDTVAINRLGLVDTKLWKTMHTTNAIESVMDSRPYPLPQ